MQKLKKYKPVVAGSIVAGALAVVAMPSLAYGQTNNHPVFVTIENVEGIVAEAVANFGTSIDHLVSRMDVNESADGGRDNAIAALEGQVAAQQQLMASQSAQLAELDQTVDAYESRISLLETDSHPETPTARAALMLGSFMNGESSFSQDLSEFEVATYEFNTSSGEGDFEIEFNDPVNGWTPIKRIHVSAENPVLQSTVLLKEGEHRVIFRGPDMVNGRVNAIYY